MKAEPLHQNPKLQNAETGPGDQDWKSLAGVMAARNKGGKLWLWRDSNWTSPVGVKTAVEWK